MGTREPWVPAMQYFGTRGFFPSYDARPGEILEAPTANAWARAAGMAPGALPGLTRGAACERCYEMR